MSLGLLIVGITAVAIVCVGVFLYYFSKTVVKGRSAGTPGIVQRSRLICPKCGQQFDYDWVPGGSLTAVRLGPNRYMACPLCHKWSVFPILDTIVERTPHSDGSGS